MIPINLISVSALLFVTSSSPLSPLIVLLMSVCVLSLVSMTVLMPAKETEL